MATEWPERHEQTAAPLGEEPVSPVAPSRSTAIPPTCTLRSVFAEALMRRATVGMSVISLWRSCLGCTAHPPLLISPLGLLPQAPAWPP
jgi:hypothetical protein